MTMFFDPEYGDWFVKLNDGSITRFKAEDHMHLMPGLDCLPYGINNIQLKEEKLTCEHDWKVYDSGWVAYEFCTKCDIKKKNI